MSTAPSQDDAVLDLTCQFGDLRISISGPASQATDLLRSITSGQLGSTSAASSAASVAPSFDLVSQQPAGYQPPRGYPARLEHRDTILATFRPCPDYLLEGSSKLVGSKLCGADRVRRAYLAGQWAKAVRDRRVPSPNRTPPIELKNRFYAILSGGIGLDKPTVFNSSASYWAAIGNSLSESPAISHGFPSQTEARTYLAGADVIEFDIKP